MSLLICASQAGSVEISRRLIELGADVNLANHVIKRILHKNYNKNLIS